eukprot:403345190
MSGIVEFDVGGQIIKTIKDTITKYPKSRLCHYIAKQEQLQSRHFGENISNNQTTNNGKENSESAESYDKMILDQLGYADTTTSAAGGLNNIQQEKRTSSTKRKRKLKKDQDIDQQTIPHISKGEDQSLPDNANEQQNNDKTQTADFIEIFIDHNPKRFQLMLDCLRDNEIPKPSSKILSSKERYWLRRDLKVFGPFQGVKGLDDLYQQSSCDISPVKNINNKSSRICMDQEVQVNNIQDENVDDKPLINNNIEEVKINYQLEDIISDIQEPNNQQNLQQNSKNDSFDQVLENEYDSDDIYDGEIIGDLNQILKDSGDFMQNDQTDQVHAYDSNSEADESDQDNSNQQEDGGSIEILNQKQKLSQRGFTGIGSQLENNIDQQQNNLNRQTEKRINLFDETEEIDKQADSDIYDITQEEFVVELANSSNPNDIIVYQQAIQNQQNSSQLCLSQYKTSKRKWLAKQDFKHSQTEIKNSKQLNQLNVPNAPTIDLVEQADQQAKNENVLPSKRPRSERMKYKKQSETRNKLSLNKMGM